MSNPGERRRSLRKILQGAACLTPASVSDPLSMRAAQDLGFEVAMLAGSVASLTAAGKRSADLVDGFLETAVAAVGPNRPAAEVTPGDIVLHLSAIHDRGAKVHAAKVRAYLSAAFAHGLKAEHDYTGKDACALGYRQQPDIR